MKLNTASHLFILLSVLLLAATGAAQAAPVFMSSEWAVEACKAWNADPALNEELKKSGWVENNKGRGFKVMQIYRRDCEDSQRVELKIADKDGKAMCVYGGQAQTDDLDSSVDYIMYAKDKHWLRMGEGKDGPMKAMMFGRLKFKGPKFEAMSNMGPFGNFLLLTGKIDADRSICPVPNIAPGDQPLPAN